MRRSALTQPLITRPAYGEDSEEGTVSEAKLPEGDPGGKGLPLGDDVPGAKTFAKPEDGIRNPERNDETLWRVDSPDDLGKERGHVDINDTNSDKHDGIGYADTGKQDGSPKTKYPYRDDRSNAHNAALFVASVATLKTAHELVVSTEGDTLKVATILDVIQQGLNPNFQERAKSCSVTLKRADIPHLRWLFSVDCGNGPKAVRIYAERAGRVVKMTGMDLHITCSCPGWRWLGPEHHAKREDYIDGKPRGTASVPVIRDPEGINRVCKHVAAVLGTVRKWQVPSAKRRAVKKAMQMNRRDDA